MAVARASSLRLAAPPDEIAAAYELRPSVRVGTAAKRLDCDPSQIRRLIRSGELRSHRLGKRGVRVYVDSIDAYQTAGEDELPSPAARPRRRLSTEHDEAVAYLRRKGLA